jgi:hypothetical protein
MGEQARRVPPSPIQCAAVVAASFASLWLLGFVGFSGFLFSSVFFY